MKGLHFTLNYNLKEKCYKMMYCQYLTLGKLSNIYKGTSNVCGNINVNKEFFTICGGPMTK